MREKNNTNSEEEWNLSEQILLFAFCFLLLDLSLAFYQLKVQGWVIQLLAGLHVLSSGGRSL